LVLTRKAFHKSFSSVVSCNLLVEAELCKATDHWETVISCDNRKNTDPTATYTCEYGLATGVEMEESSSASEFVSGSQSTSVGIEAGLSFAGLSANFQKNVGTSSTTGESWSKETSSIFNQMTEITAKFNIPPGYKSTLEQVVGTCGSLTVRPNVFRKVDTKSKQKNKINYPQNFKVTVTNLTSFNEI